MTKKTEAATKAETVETVSETAATQPTPTTSAPSPTPAELRQRRESLGVSRVVLAKLTNLPGSRVWAAEQDDKEVFAEHRATIVATLDEIEKNGLPAEFKQAQEERQHRGHRDRHRRHPAGQGRLMSEHPAHNEETAGVGSAPAPLQAYDPGRLLGDVMRLLAARELSPVVSTRDLGAAVRSCGSLLICLGIMPTRRPDLAALTDPPDVGAADPGDTSDPDDILDSDEGRRP